MNINNHKVEDIFYKEIISTKERISIKAGKCRYNFRCQMNAVHEAVRNKQSKIAMVVYMANCKVDPIIHFVNYDGKKFIDNTLGEWSQNHEYYLIRFITKKDFWNINFIFTSYREKINNSLSWWLRLTSDNEF